MNTIMLQIDNAFSNDSECYMMTNQVYKLVMYIWFFFFNLHSLCRQKKILENGRSQVD